MWPLICRFRTCPLGIKNVAQTGDRITFHFDFDARLIHSLVVGSRRNLFESRFNLRAFLWSEVCHSIRHVLPNGMAIFGFMEFLASRNAISFALRSRPRRARSLLHGPTFGKLLMKEFVVRKALGEFRLRKNYWPKIACYNQLF